MKQIIRYVIVLLVFLSIIFLARNPALGAGAPVGNNAPVVVNGVELAQDLPQGQQAQPGTVNPPPSTIVITESGTYSIGGFCTYTVEFLEPGITVEVSLERPLPRELPDGVHKSRQGCRVTYFQDGERIDEFTTELGESRICFAATPPQTDKIYFYNVYATNPTWAATPQTDVDAGVVCAAAGPSAVYVATFQTPN